MKTILCLRNIFLCGCAAIAMAFNLRAAEIPREHLSLDANWKFHLGDDWPRALDLSKAGASSGPAAEKFNDDTWRNVNLPHDWAVELPFDKFADRNHGFKTLGPGFAANNIGWYRRTFELAKEEEGKRIWLTFDGVFRDATVWVNGWLVSRHESGYCPLRRDITDAVRFGGKNLVTVRANATEFEGWFYESAGIYRHVWLDKTGPEAIAPDGIFVCTKFKNNVPSDQTEISVEANILNTLTNTATTTVKCEILSPDGKLVADFKKSEKVNGESQQAVKLTSKMSAQRHLQSPGPRWRRRGDSRCAPIFPHRQAERDGLQRLSHVAQSAHAGIARCLRPPRHDRHGRKPFTGQ
jgi:beta-galactosidase